MSLYTAETRAMDAAIIAAGMHDIDPRFLIAPPAKSTYWKNPPPVYLIEVKFTSTDESRSARWFDGSCEPGWHGNTTMDAGHAQIYHTRADAEAATSILAPRLIGDWHIVEHIFT